MVILLHASGDELILFLNNYLYLYFSRRLLDYSGIEFYNILLFSKLYETVFVFKGQKIQSVVFLLAGSP